MTLPKNNQVTKQLWTIFTLFLVVHGALFIHGIYVEESFFAGDRANTRFSTIQFVFLGEEYRSPSAEDASADPGEQNLTFLARVLKSGKPGDYFIQGLLYSIGGAQAVIAVQLLLSFLSVISAYFLALLLSLPTRYALLVATLYMILPASLVQPHQLSSEAIFNPLVVMSFFAIIGATENKLGRSALMTGAILMALAIFVRPQLILYPFVLAAILALHDWRRWKWQIIGIVPVCFLLPVVWGLIVFGLMGEYEVGGRNYGLVVYFYNTVERMAVIGNFPFDAAGYPDKAMPTTDFIRYVLEYPVAIIQLKLSALFNLVLNPGTYSVASHHLGIVADVGDTSFWRDVRDRDGLSGMIAEVFQRGPAMVGVVIGGALMWGAILAGAAKGAFAFARGGEPTSLSKTIVLSYLSYALMIAWLVTGARWGQRTPVEFVIVILLAFGVRALSQWLKQKAPTNA